ncbi:hypothetical protein ACL02S_08080 [Nocardia sp. 004]|uniref:hypothetical protein n=1 Tax=Nocardia sp. 004 TaxID=3385978 RepID=UPI0039A1390E
MGRQEYTTLHFSQSNPLGEGQADVPKLLKTVAATLQDLGDITVTDLILHNEITADGDWPSITVYYDRENGTE